MTIDDFYEFRDALAAATTRDLIGPPSHQDVRPEESVLNEPPLQRYIAGVLFPRNAGTIDGEHDVDDDDEDDFGRHDPPVSMADARFPSAMAMSFAVDPTIDSALVVTISAARYIDPGRHANPPLWERVPLEATKTIDVSQAVADLRFEVEPGLDLFARVRRPDRDGHVAVTVGAINMREQPANEFMRDPNCYFQVTIDVVGEAGRPCFVARSDSSRGSGVDDDARSHQLLFRNTATFAIGHGCAADWETSTNGASRITSTFTPTVEVRLADSNPAIDTSKMGMRHLATAGRADVTSDLTALVAGYRTWIDRRRTDVANLAAHLQPIAREHLDRCAVAADRVEAGIRLLDTDDSAFAAFQLMNRAMQNQRARSVWHRDQFRPLDEDSDSHRWRPFQIAFVLLNLEGVSDPESPDRDTVDLLWFPTGGGKTEAYLGLIAFTIFLRRLRSGGKAGGLSVIMRYTLRLLTLQQFQRAAILICACEQLRRSRNDLGRDQISICLWVGRAATPNNIAETRKALGQHKQGKPPATSDPVQIDRCPWCGHGISHRDYWVRKDDSLVILCPNESCEFHKGLPAYVVDEDVYKVKPTLMIATVDKFASLPWRDNVADLLDVGRQPPDLIIQDELHLITGPLGTLVGLYETAVDMLCENGNGRGPKVIASTATIRRAAQQIGALYAADSFQFPPPGIDAADSYFAVEAPRSEKGTRRYLGLMAPATSHSSLLVRTYAALLEYASTITADDEVRDQYWTLLGYFNSLRVLGAALLQVRDDVSDRAQLLASREGHNPRIAEVPELQELTSRVPSSDVPAILSRMARSLGSGEELDVILATNMISVGVDVDRLGLMAVMGQPQSASEYIQATSRVGRQNPGLVAVLFNANRSRDRSHYEGFTGFHRAIYKQVDVSSVTPFSARARDRGLHAVLIALIRGFERSYRGNSAAASVNGLETIAAPYRTRILDRVARVAPEEVEATAKALDDIVDRWKQAAESAASRQSPLQFRHSTDPASALLVAAGTSAATLNGIETLWSLRDVDTESNLAMEK